MSLDPSNRIKIISTISARLGEENWSLIDLTLSQFGLPTTEDWNGAGDRSQYIIAMLSNAPDDKLIGLASHVGIDQKTNDPGIEPPFWTSGLFKVFLSHLAVNRKEAAELQETLGLYGISCFVAHNDIKPTAEWQSQIEAALSTCDSLIALLHPGFHDSKWTDQEVGFVMGRGLPIFSIRYGHAPQGFIGRFQAFEGSGKEVSTLAKEIFDTYIKHKATKEKMAHVIVGVFERSLSFQQANRFMGFLEQLESWDPSFPQRIIDAKKNNFEVAHAFEVTDSRLQKLFSKWDQK
ncbi:MAG: toll/interleukin-1 receptor domain-containing protein [Parcubacteria group bacterium]|jgi:hypothetical protein